MATLLDHLQRSSNTLVTSNAAPSSRGNVIQLGLAGATARTGPPAPAVTDVNAFAACP